MDKAFARANEGLPTLVGFAGHDFRDLGIEVDHLRELILSSAKKYPEVKFRYCESLEAFRYIMSAEEDITGIEPLELEIVFHPATEQDVPNLEIVTKRGKVFGPQPFLAIKTKSRRYIHDNLDFSVSGDRWFYAFHGDTLPFEDVAEIGVAANDKLGNLCVQKKSF
jgi:hypothetical protein